MQWHLTDDDTSKPNSKGKKFLVLMPSRSEKNEVRRIVWSEGIPGKNVTGTSSTEYKCRKTFDEFVKKYGVPHQWVGAGDKKYHENIWHGLNEAYQSRPVLRFG
jgi:hypothetical protein